MSSFNSVFVEILRIEYVGIWIDIRITMNREHRDPYQRTLRYTDFSICESISRGRSPWYHGRWWILPQRLCKRLMKIHLLSQTLCSSSPRNVPLNTLSRYSMSLTCSYFNSPPCFAKFDLISSRNLSWTSWSRASS